ncbi:hypothetical protein AA11826_1269 [Komagataeibacter oboediens DSM 11826]|uniref:Uncharacterized protein n=1 Tax=Komagataeibacter oboediens TaxID=65958 RepID=A0A318QTP7_9PROT|nr:hypothetical protein [Komagataeibacter oboediens]PYD81640.1 hypothetical protein CFR80_10510 [Komagataeibacter oboediens]GBR34692.1 hypothetical protein AA11826_1269 [Komagataeibacter oboediens DSM 11826]
MQKRSTSKNYSPVIQNLRDSVLTIDTYARIGWRIGKSYHEQGKQQIDLKGPVEGAATAIAEMANISGIKTEDAMEIATVMAVNAVRAFEEAEEDKGDAA